MFQGQDFSPYILEKAQVITDQATGAEPNEIRLVPAAERTEITRAGEKKYSS
jgi:hypothetical protein